MAEVVLDPTTRAPSTAWAKLLRLLLVAGAAKGAIWLSGYGVTLSATDQVALVTIATGIFGAIGTEARDRGWPILRVIFMLPLVLSLGCACLGIGTPTPAKAWSMALTSYTSATQAMTAYCAQPQAEKGPCVSAANATRYADLIVLSTDTKLKAGKIEEAELAAATATLNATLPLLQRAAGGQ